MTEPKHVEYLRSLGVCKEAVEFAQKYPDADAAWQARERGDWMFRYLGMLCKHGTPGHRRLVLLTCECVRPCLKYVPDDEPRPRTAVETAERWAREEEGVTLDDVAAAARAAWTAATEAARVADTEAAAVAAEAAAVAATELADIADRIRRVYPNICPVGAYPREKRNREH